MLARKTGKLVSLHMLRSINVLNLIMRTNDIILGFVLCDSMKEAEHELLLMKKNLELATAQLSTSKSQKRQADEVQITCFDFH